MVKPANQIPADTASPNAVCKDSIKESLVGYPAMSELRTTVPLDPNVSSKPSLNVWSFLKSAIGKDLSKGIHILFIV